MIILFTTPGTDIVESITSIDQIHKQGPELTAISFEAPSRFKSNETSITHNFDSLDGMPGDIMTKPDKYIYRNSSFFLRPYIKIDVSDVLNVIGPGGVVVPINKDIQLTISYHDPDNMNFSFDFIKFKDRYDFIQVPSELNLINNTITVTVNSPFPGVAKFRAKDNKYMCYFEPIEVRFKNATV